MAPDKTVRTVQQTAVLNIIVSEINRIDFALAKLTIHPIP